MSNDKSGKELHDKQTRGERLTIEEQNQLNAWYAAEDAAEARILDQEEVGPDLETLQQQIVKASAQLNSAARQIQEVSEENSVLRQEISILRHQLASQKQPV